MAGTKKDFTDHGYSQYSLGTLGVTPLFNVPTVGASVVGTTVQAYFVTPSRIKLSAIAIACSAVSTISGAVSFNIVVGSGVYESGATSAVGSFTLTGAPTTGQSNNYHINGDLVTVAQTTGTLAAQATADAAAITAATALTGVTAVAVGANINLTANTAGVAGNFITTSGSSTGGDTVTANQVQLSGGSNGTLTVGTVQNDNRTLPYYNQAATSSQVQIAGGGSGITTNFAVAGETLFATDVSINAINTPGILVATGGSAVFGDVPTALGQQVLAASDAVFERGQILTLRVFTPSGGSITNLIVSAVSEVRNLNEPSTPIEVQLNDPLQGFVTPLTPGNIGIQNVRQVSGVTF
jgi:hypothetical protein